MDKIGNEGILRLLGDSTIRKAHFKAVIALYLRSEDKIFLFPGEVHGSVAREIRGKNGFGFDPIFIPEQEPNKTFGEMSAEEKNKYSHRSEAAKRLIEFLK